MVRIVALAAVFLLVLLERQGLCEGIVAVGAWKPNVYRPVTESERMRRADLTTRRGRGAIVNGRDTAVKTPVANRDGPGRGSILGCSPRGLLESAVEIVQQHRSDSLRLVARLGLPSSLLLVIGRRAS